MQGLKGITAAGNRHGKEFAKAQTGIHQQQLKKRVYKESLLKLEFFPSCKSQTQSRDINKDILVACLVFSRSQREEVEPTDNIHWKAASLGKPSHSEYQGSRLQKSWESAPNGPICVCVFHGWWISSSLCSPSPTCKQMGRPTSTNSTY